MTPLNYDTITGVAKKVLEERGIPLLIEEIHEQILNNNLYRFKEGANSLHILTSQINRKCINSNLSYKNKDLLFYLDSDSEKYGLLDWLTQEQKDELVQETESYLENEVETIKSQLHQLQINIEKLNSLNTTTQTFSEKIDNFQNLFEKSESQFKEAQTLINNFISEKVEVENLLDSLNGQKHQANFENFNQGFVRLLDQKNEEAKKALKNLKSFGLTILFLPIVVLIVHLKALELDLISAFPLLTIEIFLVYYFRITLHDSDSIKEQILQLENKSALLQFISNYLEYKQKNSFSSDDVSKFEEIIFSKISPNMKTIPTSPDIVSIIEKIAKIIKK